jgi:hypothetical protein
MSDTPTTPTSGEPCHHVDGTYWSAEHANFYCRRCNKGMGTDFYNTHWSERYTAQYAMGKQPPEPHPPSSGATISAEAMEAARECFRLLPLGEKESPQAIERIARSHDDFHREKVRDIRAKIAVSHGGHQPSSPARDIYKRAFRDGVDSVCDALTDDGTRGREGGEHE